jgi:ABC-type transporter Mla subunit MlaD/AraC-like DNA-binding protein
MEISQIIEHIFKNQTNINALVVIAVLTGLAIFGTFKSKNPKIKHFAKQSPAILATVGIFFSFWGISIGLIGLNLEDIQHSIPTLLEGLKAKFLASLMGIFASIVVRIAQSFSIEEELAEINVDDKIVALLGDIHTVLSKNVDDSPESLLQELKQSIEQLPSEFKKQTTLLESIKSSLAGEGDASVTTQLGKLRSDMRDSLKDIDISNKQRSDALNNTLNSNFDNLTQKFDEFARIVAENNSKAFIEALEAAMRDFNNNITEQFGENFKQLNQAVGELLKWQDNYKTHVEKLTENFEVTLKSVSVIQQAFTDIQTRSESFSNVSAELSVILQKLDAQLGDLNFHLKSLSQVAETAKDAFPTIEGNLEKLTLGFKKSTEQSLADINGTVESVGDDLKETISRLRDTTVKLRDSMEGQCETIETTSNEFKSTVDSTLKNLSRETQASIHSYQDSLQETVAAQLTAIDKTIQKSSNVVNDSIDSISRKLESTIDQTASTLELSTKNVATHLVDATDSMKKMMESQQETIVSTGTEFKNVVNETLRDLSTETQESIKKYQESLQEVVKRQLNSIDDSIKETHSVVNKTIQNVGDEFEKAIKNQSESMNKTILIAGDSFKTVIQETAKEFEIMAETIAESIDLQEKTLKNVSQDVKMSRWQLKKHFVN